MKTEEENKVTKFMQAPSQAFIDACDKAKIKPTKRQASKWLMKKGAAWKFGRN